MVSSILMRVLGRSSGPFFKAARRRGLSSTVARILEPAARDLAPDSPEDILESREMFEQAAMRAVMGDAGNLELSFSLVDSLASAVETLGLARESDVPDPFRRVWVESDSGTRNRGVVLRCQGGEVAVFCPPRGDSSENIGNVLKVTYRGFASEVGYDLRLNDAVRLPGALVLHFTRPGGTGAIGRDTNRYPVNLQGMVSAIGNEADVHGSRLPCTILDLSSGGLRMDCSETYPEGQIVHIEVQLGDGDQSSFVTDGVVCWVGAASEEGRFQGILFRSLSEHLADRLDRFLSGLPKPAPKE